MIGEVRELGMVLIRMSKNNQMKKKIFILFGALFFLASLSMLPTFSFAQNQPGDTRLQAIQESEALRRQVAELRSQQLASRNAQIALERQRIEAGRPVIPEQELSFSPGPPLTGGTIQRVTNQQEIDRALERREIYDSIIAQRDAQARTQSYIDPITGVERRYSSYAEKLAIEREAKEKKEREERERREREAAANPPLGEEVGGGNPGGGDPAAPTAPPEFDTTEINAAICDIFDLMEGGLGALLSVAAGVGALFAMAFGAYKAGYGLIVVAAAGFVVRSFVAIFFGTFECPV